MPSSISDVHDSGVDSRRHNMHQGPLSGPVERQGMMVSLAAAHPSATSKVARARQGLQERALRRATRHATGVLPRNQLEIIGDGVRSFLNRATGALVAAAIHFPIGKSKRPFTRQAGGNWPNTPPRARSAGRALVMVDSPKAMEPTLSSLVPLFSQVQEPTGAAPHTARQQPRAPLDQVHQQAHGRVRSLFPVPLLHPQ